MNDVIAGGPGYIAVGGGSFSGRDHKAVVWVSEDGKSWQSASLVGEAADGAIEAVTALRAGGYVAVGRDSEPRGRGSDVPPNALVWHSDDGLIWTRIVSPQSFSSSIMFDVAATTQGVVAVGCKADSESQCTQGQAWSSTDGLGWTPTSQVPIVPYTVSVNGDVVVAGGTDDTVTASGGRAVIANLDGEHWIKSDSLGKPSSQISGSSQIGDGFALAGWQRDPDGGSLRAVIFISADGATWDRVTAPRFRRMLAQGLDASGDLVLVVGIRPSADIGAPPVALWSRDLQHFRESRFPDDLNGDGLELIGAKIPVGGTLAFVVGADGYHPAIWFSELD